MNTNRIKILLPIVALSLFALSCGFISTATSEDLQVQSTSPSAVSMPESAATQIAQPQTDPSQPLPSIITDEDQVLIELYNRINPAVVNIITYDEQDEGVFPSGQGSGFLYSREGYIITNAHVVHGSDDLEVVFSDNTILTGEVIGEDLHSDLAVIKVESLPDDIQPVTLGNIDDIAVGQTVVAIGNPFGLGGTLTRGIVSALGRTIPALTPFSIPQAIQTDAPINPGNSGGPLLNLRGEVIGVNAQIETNGDNRSNSGVGFAIPVSIVERVIPVLIENGKFEWAWFGVTGSSLTPNIVEAMNIPFNKGAYLFDVIEGGPSAQANLQGATDRITVNNRLVEIGGDVITAIEGQPVNSFEDLLIYISLYASPGDDVTITIWRDGEYQDVTVQLEERPASDNLFLP